MEDRLYTGTINYLEQIFTVVSYLTAGRQSRIPHNCASEYTIIDEKARGKEMIVFESDYSEGCLPEILERMKETNLVQVSGYGNDCFTQSAVERIREACGCLQADVRLLAGGTQANQVVIDSMLESFEGVIATDTGHIACHEAGAVEFTGHKVLTVPNHDGKMKAGDLKNLLETFYGDGNHEHMVYPGMVYITYPTEYGTLYSRDELLAIGQVCRTYEIPLYLDGARLFYGLAACRDVDLKLIAEVCDAFYIGGTKAGALLGEAVVFTRKVPSHWMTRVKQHGALLAKGRVVGIQFDVMFEDDLALKYARNAIELARYMKEELVQLGYRLHMDSPTNQQFFVLSDQTIARLKGKVGYSFWEKVDEGHTAIRLATSWASTRENVDRLIEAMKEAL